MRIKKPKFWDNKKKTIISNLLLPLSFLYQMFFWINKCYNYCEKNNLLKEGNIRLPIFIVERFIDLA